MVWVKRLSPLVLILAAWFIHSAYDKYREKKFTAEADRRALVTAQIWVASAKYRGDPPRYLAFRDSVLKANSLSSREMDDYLKVLEGNPDHQQVLTDRISHYMDSLYKIEDSLRIVGAKHRDSIRTAHADSVRKAEAATPPKTRQGNAPVPRL